MTKFPTYSDGSKPKIGIVGAGISGILMSIYLKERLNIHDFVVFEGESEIGGTWHMNTYPGCACDVNSHLYAFYCNLNKDWSKNYSGYSEIQEYLADTVDKYNFKQNIQFNSWVTQARFEPSDNKWKLIVRNKVTDEYQHVELDFLIGSVGALRIPNIPKELTTFEGPWMHSAKWDHTIDLTDKKVGIIGSGASAVQIVPQIVDRVKELHTFHRNPPYCTPKNISDYSELFKFLLVWVPFLHTLYYWYLFLSSEIDLIAFYTDSWMSKIPTRETEGYIKKTIRDPRKRELMTPKYHFGCKRVTPSDTYYQAIDLDKVAIHDGNIDKIKGNTIYLKDGTSQTVDVLILATGFKVSSPYKDMDIVNLDGDHIDANLDKVGYSPQVNLGITVARAPNFFIMLGPTTGLGHNSITFMLECQANYIAKFLGNMMKRDIGTFDLKPEVGDAYWQWVQRRVKPMVWHGNCKSWYQNSNGEVFAVWPGTCIEYYLKTLRPKMDDYEFLPISNQVN